MTLVRVIVDIYIAAWGEGPTGSPVLQGAPGAVSAGVGPAACVVFEEDGFDEFADEGLFVGVEVAGGCRPQVGLEVSDSLCKRR